MPGRSIHFAVLVVHDTWKKNRTPQLVQEENGRKANVEFLKTIVSESSSHLKPRDIMYVRALQNIERREEVIVDYGTSYQFVRAHRPGLTNILKECKNQASVHFALAV